LYKGVANKKIKTELRECRLDRQVNHGRGGAGPQGHRLNLGQKVLRDLHCVKKKER